MDGLMVKHLNYGVRRALCNGLDPEMVSGHNWKMLAEKLGYTYEEIMALEARQTVHGSNTQKLLEDYGLRRNSTLQNLCNQLEAMDRQDSVQVVEEALPDIRKAYEDEMNLEMMQRGQAQKPGPCTCSSVHSYQRHLSAPTPNNFQHFSQSDHCYGPCQSNMGQEYSSSLSMNDHHSRSRVNSSPGVCYSPVSSGPNCNCHYTRPAPQPARVPQGSCEHGVRKIQNISCQPPPAQRPKFQAMVSVEDNNVANCSMVVRHSNSLVHARQEDFLETHSPPINVSVLREHPVPLEQGILRAMPFSDSVPPLKQAVDMEVAAEEEVFTSSDSSGSASSSLGPVFQNPTEVHKKQPSSSGGDGNRRRSRVVGMERNNHPNQETSGSVERVRTTSVDQHGMNSGRITRNKSCTSTHSKCRFCCVNKSGRERNQQVCQAHNGHSQQAGSHSSSHNNSIQRIPPVSQSVGQHYPEPNPVPYTTVAGTQKPIPSTKVKLAEICKGSRKVKVFVTYATDGERHQQRVADLSDCLEKNGFSSHLDMKERDQMMEDRLRWYDSHFMAADFVLLCVSPLYKQQTQSSNNGSSLDCNPLQDPLQDSIHTTYIYKLMQSEFVRLGSRNKRFIPLVFPGATRDDVPTWLRNTLIYQWPSQYKDLLWMLTKPQDKVSNSMV
ncbi:uncharacterized protein LOC135468023 [Liolophura sinensis]|uniref:uncharacterized protein LOC135468023 n=1 Tax=Liolophura sinensis TaxID=3198878 RepID=UPI0031597EBB